MQVILQRLSQPFMYAITEVKLGSQIVLQPKCAILAAQLDDLFSPISTRIM